jgi:hypothetical protein
LADRISFGQPSHSALPNHVHCLDTPQRPSPTNTARIHLDTTFGHQLGDLLVGERIPEIPADAQDDHFSRELATLERIVRVDRVWSKYSRDVMAGENAPTLYDECSAMSDRFHWARLLAFVTGLVNQELLLRNEYLAAENRILRAHLPSRLRLSDAERSTLAEIAKRLEP